MHTENLRNGIVRILKPSGRTAGTGFVVSDQWILTCAHVVEQDEETPKDPIRLIVLATGQEFTAVVEEQYWRDSKREDVALLRLQKTLPPEVKPLTLGTSTNIENHSFRTYGFPDNHPQEVLIKGSVDCEIGNGSLLQLTSKEITEGVSGAPVFDQQTQRVVGIVTARAPLDLREVTYKVKSKTEKIPVSTGRMEEIAFATPSRVLVAICPEISIEDICPYRGLSAFTEADSNFFFGRDELVDQLIEQLRRNPRFLTVVGSSGSGKSSVIQAGLFPRIQQGVIPGWQSCQIIKCRPGSDPKQALINALENLGLYDASFAVDAPSSVESSYDFFTDIYQRLRLDSNHKIIFIDQFEELFALCSLENQKNFTESLLRLVESDLSITTILTIRADFYSQLLNSCFGSQSKFDVLRMEEKELRATIIQPALKVGLQLEPGLADLITRDLENTKNPLPLLEFTLENLWIAEHLSNLLTCDRYEKMGRVTGAIARWADDTYQSLNNELDRRLTRQIFTSLIRYAPAEIPDTRLRLPLSELINTYQDSAKVYQLIKAFTDKRLIVTSIDQKTGEEVLEIIHDAVIQEWGRLRKWIEDNRNKLIEKDKIEDSSKEWEENGKSDDYLFRGKQLQGAKQYWNSTQSMAIGLPKLSPRSQEFLQKSIRRQRWNGRALGVLSLIFFIVLGSYVILVGPYSPGNELKIRLLWYAFKTAPSPRKSWALQELAKAGASLRTIDLSGDDLSGIYLQYLDLDLSRSNLSNANLSDANLSEVNLNRANLSNTNLAGTDLRGANLNGANLNGANLTQANLGVDLTKPLLRNIPPVLLPADLRYANLQDADLNNANLSGADLRNTNFSNANLDHVIFKNALYNQETKFPKNFDPTKYSMHLIAPNTNLSGAFLFNLDFSNADLSGANLSGAKLRSVMLDARRSNFEGVNLSNANLKGADFGSVTLNKANLNQADLEGANLKQANLDGASLQNANVRGANLRGTSLADTNLSGSDFRGALYGNVNVYSHNEKNKILYRESTRFPGEFDPVKEQMHRLGSGENLSGLNLEGVDLSNADLSDANLSNTNLSRSSFRNTDLSASDLSNSDLSGANLNGADFGRDFDLFNWKFDFRGAANLKGANLNGASLMHVRNLTPEQVKAALNWERARYDEKFCHQLELKECPQEDRSPFDAYFKPED